MLSAKRFLVVPRAVYIYRKYENSTTRTTRTFEEQTRIFIEPATIGLTWLEKFMNKIEFFQENPDYSRTVLMQFAFRRINICLRKFIDKSDTEIYEAVRSVVRKNPSECDILLAALCVCINALQKAYATDVAQAQEIISQLEKQLQSVRK